MKFGSPIGRGVPLQRPAGRWHRRGVPGFTVQLVASILQVALPPHHEGVSEITGVGWGGEILQSRLLGNFTPLFLLNGLFGRQGVLFLRLSFLQLGLIEAGDFSHVRLVCHFSYNLWILVPSSHSRYSHSRCCGKRPLVHFVIFALPLKSIFCECHLYRWPFLFLLFQWPVNCSPVMSFVCCVQTERQWLWNFVLFDSTSCIKG